MVEESLVQKHHGALYDMRGLGFAAGEVVVVTGAGSGIGRATALAAARSGLSVAICDICTGRVAIRKLEVEGMGAKALALIGAIATVTIKWAFSSAPQPPTPLQSVDQGCT